MSKYSMSATKQDYLDIYRVLQGLEKQLNTTFDWKKIKRVSLDELSALVGILKRKLPTKSQDSIVATKLGNIDIDNIRLGIVITKDGEIFETTIQYNISSNTAHHSDIEFENLMEVFGVDMEKVIDDIESRKLVIK